MWGDESDHSSVLPAGQSSGEKQPHVENYDRHFREVRPSELEPASAWATTCNQYGVPDEYASVTSIPQLR